MIDILTGTAFDAPKRLNHRDDEVALEFPSSVSSRVRHLNALKAQNWRASGARWTNPYITDGLVAMWDAEWNEGGGVHNPSAKSLNDLSGNGWDIAAPNATFGDNWMTSSAPIQVETPTSWRETFKNKNWSVEVVCEYVGEFAEDKLISPQVVPFGMKQVESQAYQDAPVVVKAFYEYRRNGGSIAMSHKFGENETAKTEYYVAPKWSVHAGSFMGDTGPMVFTVYATNAGTVNKQINNRTKYDFNAFTFFCSDPRARIYSIRFYNRALTEDEAWANINVDKERFGIA